MGCTLIIGGAKSGKSSFALRLCSSMKGKKIFVATAVATDSEMEEKIKRHRKERGKEWITIEEPVDIAEIIERFDSKETVILVDCLTFWLNNLFMKKENVEERIEKLIRILSGIKGNVVIVSNEVGMGIVPADEISRKYRELLGLLNQKIAHLAEKVVFMICGIPVLIKPSQIEPDL